MWEGTNQVARPRNHSKVRADAAYLEVATSVAPRVRRLFTWAANPGASEASTEIGPQSRTEFNVQREHL